MRTEVGLCLIAAAMAASPLSAQERTVTNSEYLEFNYGQDTGGDQWVQSIAVTSPAYRSTVRGKVTVEFRAPGMTVAKAMCWRQPTKEHPGRWGHDVNLTPGGIELGQDAKGSFALAADKFPHGPMNVRILAHNGKGKRDLCELQLYNAGGVKWNEGLPAEAPAAAKGMKLVFADDFDGPLSIANDGRGARYNAHKPRFGDFSGWPFNNVDSAQPPFEQIGTYLRIKARKAPRTRGSTGFLATVDMDGKGFWAQPPCYLECRLIAQSAPGTWPAFWTYTALDRGVPGDELDIAELYGGVGKKNPNHPGYSIVSHFWGQTNPDGSKKKEVTVRPKIMALGGKSYWSSTFHTYAVHVGLEDTVYYFDNIEVLRHPTNDRSRDYPACFLLNYAIGGISGWPIDLKRFGHGSDMYIDWVRVYAKEKTDYSLPRPD
jgi:hypothetical protein